ncbi:MAG: AAA family ATPase [Candidatus Competibacteraceae bacterium]
MYNTYFGFDDKQFKFNDPRNFYSNPNFKTVCADLLAGIRAHRGFMVLTGEAGVGKTVTLRHCMVTAGEDIRFVLLTNTNLDFPDIINYLCANLEIKATGLDLPQQISQLLDVLATHASQGRTIALVIDDAHTLRVKVLVQLRGFVEMSTTPERRLQVVLVGLPELEGKLRQPGLRSLWDSLIRCRLNRLEDHEVELFIRHQLQMAGDQNQILLSPAVIQHIAQYCKGVPRAIAMLYNTLVLFASLEHDRDITPELVDEAARSCFLDVERPQLASVTPRAVVAEPANRLDLGLPADFVLDDNSIPLLSAVEQLDQVPHDVARNLQPELATDSALVLPELDASSSGSVKAKLEPVAERSQTTSGGVVPSQALAEGEPDEANFSHDETQPKIAAIPQTEVQPDAESADSQQTVAKKGLSAKPTPQLSTHLRELERLLYEILAKKSLKTERDQKALLHFQVLYFQALFSLDGRLLTEYEQRMARLAERQQPILVELATDVEYIPGRPGVFCALVINPTWWLFREVRLRLVCPDIVLADGGRVPPLKLLDGRDAQPVYLEYEAPDYPLRTTVRLELDLCDHRGDWQAYNSASSILLDFPGRNKDRWIWTSMTNQSLDVEHFLLSGSVGVEGAPAPDWLWPVDTQAGTTASRSGILMHTLSLELEANSERVRFLRSQASTGRQALSRGTTMTRALLRSTNPAHAPARIELVSRPFMIFGRYNETTNKGFGDFALGFVPEYERISRLHCVICALGEQLAVMPTSNQGRTYTAWNDQRLERGDWQALEAGDTLDICGLYRLRVALGWDKKARYIEPSWDIHEPRIKFGRYLLELIDLLRQLDRDIGAGEQRAMLKARYLNLLHMQDRAAELSGVGKPGILLYARFERNDPACGQVVHYYLPKWLPLGSSPESGLQIKAEGVAPHHAELLFRDGIYWIQNLAGHGAVRVCSHGLATNEVLALEEGDVVMIGTARFVFGSY